MEPDTFFIEEPLYETEVIITEDGGYKLQKTNRLLKRLNHLENMPTWELAAEIRRRQGIL